MVLVLTAAEKTLWDAGGDWKQGFLAGAQKVLAQNLEVQTIVVQDGAGVTLLSAVRDATWTVV